MNFIKVFSNLSKKDTGIAGGKGASLGEMTQAGIPVPPGFVVLAESFDRFLEEAQIRADVEAILERVNQEDTNSVDGASAQIQSIILSAIFPEDIAREVMESFAELDAEFVAVRSSATAEDGSSASWAGELESYLNTTRESLLENIKKCWASLFTPRAIFYRIEKNLHAEKVSVAVVIQKMIQSEISGICFTVHPVTENYNQMVIEAGYGLGEAIVGGMITPDTYVIDKEKVKTQNKKLDEIIIDKYISSQEMKIVRDGQNGTKEVSVGFDQQEKQKLGDNKILKIAEICLNIEKHYGFPCDIEWAMENDHFYIVQSRPITTLSKNSLE